MGLAKRPQLVHQHARQRPLVHPPQPAAELHDPLDDRADARRLAEGGVQLEHLEVRERLQKAEEQIVGVRAAVRGVAGERLVGLEVKIEKAEGAHGGRAAQEVEGRGEVLARVLAPAEADLAQAAGADGRLEEDGGEVDAQRQLGHPEALEVGVRDEVELVVLRGRGGGGLGVAGVVERQLLREPVAVVPLVRGAGFEDAEGGRVERGEVAFVPHGEAAPCRAEADDLEMAPEGPAILGRGEGVEIGEDAAVVEVELLQVWGCSGECKLRGFLISVSEEAWGQEDSRGLFDVPL